MWLSLSPPGNLEVVVRRQSHKIKGTGVLSLLGRELPWRAAKRTKDIV